MRAIASDWRLSEIIRVQSGSFITVATGTDQALNGNAGPQRVNYNGTNPYANAGCTQTPFCVPWLSQAAFSQPSLGTFGNLGSASILGPGAFQMDMSLVRAFQVRERQKVEIRAEAFNLLNHYRPGNPAASLGTLSTFGQITSSGDPRIMQFAVKYIF
jgi:hypothetical protein